MRIVSWKRYAYMTRVDLCSIMICDYDGEPTIYAELEATVPNVFDANFYGRLFQSI